MIRVARSSRFSALRCLGTSSRGCQLLISTQARLSSLSAGRKALTASTPIAAAREVKSSCKLRASATALAFAAAACLGLSHHHQAQCERDEGEDSSAAPLTTHATANSNDNDGAKKTYSLLQKCLAEAVGTGIIVSGGCGAVCASKFSGGPPLSPATVALAFGTSVALAAYATRDVSGAHLNPALTASFAFHDPDDCPLSVAIPYALAQVGGATAAAALNYAAYRKGIAALHVAEKAQLGTAASSSLFNGAFHMIPNRALVGNTPRALVVEIALTSVLAFMVFALTDEEKSVPEGAAPALIGATVAALVVPGAPLTGCGMNPARDLGPRIVAATTGGLGMASLAGGWWLYTVGPVIGGIAGGSLYKATLAKKVATNGQQ